MRKANDSGNEAADANKSTTSKQRVNIKRDHNVSPSTGAGDDNSGDEQDHQTSSGDNKQKRVGRSPDNGTQQARGKRFDPSAAYQPVFYFGGKNGETLVDSILTNLGWKRTPDKASSNIKLRWTECRGSINYAEFRDGEQLVNHIPNCELLTNKLGLLMSLRDYERVATTIQNKTPRLRLTDFHPETYVLADRSEVDMFYETFKQGEIWICKPTGLNQGIGIYLVRDIEQFKHDWNAKMDSEASLRGRPPKRDGRIIQRYIMQPLLVDDRKFDIRCYMMIACTVPYLVLFHNGYLRLSMYKYNTELQDLTVHLTNQYIQKKDPAYESVKNDTVWSMEKFNDYMNNTVAPRTGLARDWVGKVLVPRMRQIAAHVVNCVRSKFAAKVGFFELFGLDFMVDSDMKVWLIEINTNPSLTTNCEVLKQAIPPAVTEGVQIVLECFEKARRRQPLMPVQSLKSWDVLYHGPGGSGGLGMSIRYSPPPGRKADNGSPERAENAIAQASPSPLQPQPFRTRAELANSPPAPAGPFRRAPPSQNQANANANATHLPGATSRRIYAAPLASTSHGHGVSAKNAGPVPNSTERAPQRADASPQPPAADRDNNAEAETNPADNPDNYRTLLEAQ